MEESECQAQTLGMLGLDTGHIATFGDATHTHTSLAHTRQQTTQAHSSIDEAATAHTTVLDDNGFGTLQVEREESTASSD